MKKNDNPLILVVDDEPKIREILSDILSIHNYRVLMAKDGEEALELFEKNPVSLVLLDYVLPGIDGIDVLKRMIKINSLVPIILLSARANVSVAVEAIRTGAIDLIEKPIKADIILERIDEQLRKGQRSLGEKKTISEFFERYRMIGKSESIQATFRKIEQVAPVNIRILVSGETGTGKELVANAIHALSSRAFHPFIKINCAAIPTELIESELFGYQKGSFTGAFANRDGKFQKADKGTLFLDEIGDMSLMTQAKVLRALEEGEIQQIGASKTEKIDVRVIAATHRDLEKEVEMGRFREDLYYRLNVVTIHVPSLNQRKEDIPFLVHHFFYLYCEQYNRQMKYMTERALECLLNYDWKGNVRELRNLVEKLVILEDDEIIDIKHIQRIAGKARLGENIALDVNLKEAREQFEREYILAKLISNGWKMGETADQLGIERTNLYRKMKQLNIDQPDE